MNNKNGANGNGNQPRCDSVHDWFRLCAHKVALVVGSPWAFLIACATVILWACTGKLFGFSDTWQLVINTATTIITFLMVFIIQNTQNRDTKAIHLKLDELLRGVKGARTSMVNLETLTDEELDRLQQEFERLRGPMNRVHRRRRMRHRRHHRDPHAAGKQPVKPS